MPSAMNAREAILEADRRYVFRPYTATTAHEREDSIVVVSAEGPYLVDADGRRFLDGSGAWWCNHLGFQHPRIVEALRRQASQLSHCALAGATHEPAARLAEELVALAPPGMARVFFSDNGSTSVEVAAKLAFQYWHQNGRPERKRFLVLPGGYHGDTIGAMSLSAVDAFNAIFRPLFFDAVRPPDEVASAGFEAVFAWMAGELANHGDTIAAVVVEPLVQGAAGMRMYPPELLRSLREAADRADTFLIFDEVFTGFGRTGTFWAAEQAGARPDLLCTSKGLTGGTLPFAATLVTERVYDGFRGDKLRTFMHGHTFCGNPLGAAVAREVLAVYREEDVLERSRPKAARIAEAFAELGRESGVIATRSLGMIGAADLGGGGYHGGLGWAVHDEAKKRGAHCRPLGDTVYVVPPLTIPDDDLDRLLDIVHASIRAVTGR